MTEGEAKRLLTVLKLTGAGELEGQRRKVAGPMGEAFMSGANWMLDRIVEVMDFSSFAKISDFGLSELRERCERFCREQCPFSRKQPPGEHAACLSCLLAQVTIQAVRNEVKHAMKGVGDDTGIE